MLGPCSDPGPVLSQPVPRPGMCFRKCYWGAAEVQHELLPCGVLESIFFPEVRNEAEGFWFHRRRNGIIKNGLPSGTAGATRRILVMPLQGPLPTWPSCAGMTSGAPQ